MKNEEEFIKTGQKIKSELAEANKAEQKSKAIALSELETVTLNPELSKMYQENAELGSANLGAALPYLKVHAAGRSSVNELADGTSPTDGWFFYTPTHEQWKEITCHILTISKGFYAEGMETDKTTGKKKMVFNQIMSGIIIDGDDYKPFLIFLSGKKLNPMWEFGKAARTYTRSKTHPVPLFVLTIQLTTQKVNNVEYGGYSWIINFAIQKSADGFPLLVTDPGKFMFLKQSVIEMEDTITSLISAKTSEKEVIKPISQEPEVRTDSDIPFD